MPNQPSSAVATLARRTGSWLGRISFPVYLGTATVVATGLMYNYLLAIVMGVGGIYILSKRRVIAPAPPSDIPNYFGKARFSRYADLVSGKTPFLLGEHTSANQYLNQHLLLGYYVYPEAKRYVSNLLGFRGEGHVLTVAQTGAGKGVSVVIPNLLNYQDSTVVIDIKGENFLHTVYQRERTFKNEIYLIDPFGIVEQKVQTLVQQLKWIRQHPDAYIKAPNQPAFFSINKLLRKQVTQPTASTDLSLFIVEVDRSIQYFSQLAKDVSNSASGRHIRSINPLQIIKELMSKGRMDEVVDEARAVANMLVVREDDTQNSHWYDKAVEVLTLMMLFLVFSPRCNKERLTKYPINLQSIDLLMEQMFRTDVTIKGFTDECNQHPLLSRYLQNLRMADQERASVLSTINRFLEPIRSGGPCASLNPTKTNAGILSDLRVTNKTVYFVLPPDKLKPYRSLSRLWIGSVLCALFNKNSPMGNKRVLFMLDEVAQLGQLEPLIQALTLGRGYGMNIWMIFQDIGQLKKIYPKEWGTILANVRFSQLFGLSATDLDTQEYVSKLCGQKTIEIFTESSSSTTGQNYSVNSGYSSSSSSDGKGGGSSGSSSSSGSSRGWSTSQSESMNNQYQSRNLLNPDEAVRLTQDRHLIIGTPYPTDAVPMKYYEINLFADRYPVALPDKLMQQLEL